MKTVSIPLGGKRGAGLVALVDEVDHHLVKGYRWSLHSQGYAQACPYKPNEPRVCILMQQLICEGGPEINHKNGNRLDNRRENLRPATSTQNKATSKIYQSNKSGYIGVHYEAARDKWRAELQVGRKRYYLGRHATAEEAARVRDVAAKKHFGAFAKLNFPDPV